MKVSKALALILVLVLACSLFAACGAGGGSSNPLVGDWASETFDGKFIYTFNDDGTGNYDAAGTAMPFTYTDEDGKLTILYDGNDIPFETEYTISGKTLTIKDSLGNDVVYNKK
ncbi:MAG: hypothetical protein IIY71_04070 [Oscillospiraceae bacterium]|nr:hypothetical protein [Oscillospiraceae bacterium]